MKRFAVSLMAVALLAIVSFAFPVFETVSVVSSRIAAYFSQTPEAATPIKDGNAPSLASDLFISEYIEGSSNNKAIEIYNGTGTPVNLATGYVLELYSNGSAIPNQTAILDGVIANGDVFVVSRNDANATILAQTDVALPTVINFNGDDAVVLKKNGVIIDVIGQIGFDPGTEWGTGLTSTADNTLTRKASVCSGDSVGSDAFDPSIEWNGFAVDTFTSIGSHTSTCLAAPEIEIEELFSGVILDGGTFNFGTQNTTSSATRTFVIHNNGTATLNLGGNLFTNTSGSGVFVITSPYSGTVAPGGTTSFQLQFTPGPGASTATMNIANNDADESPYNIVLQGFGNVPPECTASTINGAVNTAQHSIDLDTVCVDSDGTIQSIQINSVTGGPAAGSTAFANQTTHVVSLTPGNPSLPTSAVSPYVVSYTVFDDSIGSTSSTITIYVFDPPATLTTNAATSVTSTTATLNATVTSGVLFSPITARFHYGTTDPGICSDLFGTRAPTSGGSTIGGGGAFSENITGLLPGTTYYVCTLATNTGGTRVGNVQSFTTSGNPGVLSFDPLSYSPGEGGTATVTVTRTGGSDGAVSVDFGASAGVPPATGGAACAFGTGVDYINVSGTLNFANGETSKTFDVVTCNDGLFEGTESVSFSLSNAQGGATIGGSGTATVNILDDPIDFQPTIQFSMTDFNFNEGGNATVTVTRMFSPEHQLTVNYAALIGGGSNPATPGACGSFSGNDFVPTSGTLTFLPGEDTKTFDVTICDDGLFEPTESIAIALNTVSAPGVLSTPNTGRINITENDTAPTVEFSAATSSVGEGAGTKTFTVNRTGATENSFSVNFATANGTALSGSCGSGGDYVSNSGTLNFAGGDPNKTFNVTICDDGLFEGDETFSATLSSPTGGAVIGTNGTETATILENDLTPLIQFSTDRYPGTEGSGVTVSIVRTGALDNDVTADLNAGAGAGAACGQPGVDYELSNVTVHFAPGETLKQFGVPLCWEFLYEGSESWDLQLSNPTGGANIGSQSFAFIDITDSDTPPKFAFSSSAVSVPENTGTVTLNVNRTGASQNVVSVDYATTGGTATGGNCLSPGSDFLIQTGQLNFAAGDTSKTFNITICDDAEFEGDESFTVSLSNPQFPSQLGTVTTETITINDNDTPPATFVVDTTVDDIGLNVCTASANDCSLRGANSIANNGDTIAFDPGVFNLRSEAPSGAVTIDLVNGQILIDNNITINGPGANLLTIKRNSVSNFRIFAVNPGITANISGVTISNGFGSGATPGGGIYNDHGTVTITDCVISGNFGPGAGIYNDGNTSGTASLTITNSTISGNNSNFNGGGGIFNTAHFGGNAQVSITNSTISDNISEDGGAIMNNANGGTALMTITNSTISGNTATRFGGGFRNEGGLVLTNVTITKNRGNSDGDVSGQGGGIFLQGLTQPLLRNTIIAGNVQGADPGTTPNDIDQCCVNPISSFNLIGTGGSGGLVDGVNSNQVGVADARLGPLQNNGGTVFTHGFNNSGGLSPAIDKGSAFGTSFDSRGLPRTVDFLSIPNATGGDGTDIGAYEFQAPTAASVSISGRVRTIDGRGLRGAIVSITDGNGMIRQTTTSTFGYYRFEGVTAGESYVVGVASKRYRFTPIFVNVTDELRDLDFYPEP